jgi:hypothetical protein
MSGLKWRHLFWISCSVYFLLAIASAKGQWALNHELLIRSGTAIAKGIPALQKLQKSAANDLDTWSANKYGKNPWDARSQDCVTVPQKQGRALAIADITRLRLESPSSVDQVKEILGSSYCQSVDGSEVWLVGTTGLLKASPRPFSFSYSDAIPNSNGSVQPSS